MGVTQSEDKDPEIDHEISRLLSELNENDSNISSSDEFKQLTRYEIDTPKFQQSLESMRNDETFKKYNTYNIVMQNMPSFVASKKKEKDYRPGSPIYFFVYAAIDKIQLQQTLISLSIFDSLDLIDIILQYCGDGELLFAVKKTVSGRYMTLSTTTLSIDGDNFIISSTYSKAGWSGFVKLSDKYDKKLYMYLGYIIHNLSKNRDCKLSRGVMFHLDEFMRYEIEGNPRPPRPSRTVCIGGDCLILMGDGSEKRARDIKAGEFVKTSDGKEAQVICTITQRINDMIDICKITEGLYITPEHPIRDKYGKWIIPYIWFMMLMKCILR